MFAMETHFMLKVLLLVTLGVMDVLCNELRIEKLHVRSDIRYRFASTLVTSQILNTQNSAQEAKFHVQLPKPAFISNFTLEIDGISYPGHVKEKAEAKREYNSAVSRGESAAHVVEKKSRDTNNFQVAVNVAANSIVTFNLTYLELLQRKLGLYEQVIYVDPGQIVPDLKVDVYIAESREITALRVPPLRNDIKNDVVITQDNALAVVDRPSLNSAHISYHPTTEQQREDSEHGLQGQFVVQYDVMRNMDAGQVEVVDGYFVHFFAPHGLEPVSKNVLFILDISGSMSGTKIQQVRESMELILTDLKEGDFFNIILFDNSLRFWKDRMVPVNSETVQSSKEYVSEMNAEGSTDINKAILDGIRMLRDEEAMGETRLASLIIFLTDGQPTSGVTNRQRILNNVRQANNNSYTLFSLGYGGNVEYPFLQKMSAQNRGIARKIYEDSDAALQLKGFYSEIASPVLSDVKIQYIGKNIDKESLTTTEFDTYYDGKEIVVCGKFRSTESVDLLTRVTAKSASGDLELDLVFNDIIYGEGLSTPEPPSGEGLQKFMEKLWAYLTIKELLQKELKVINETEKAELKQKALDMSLKYQFVTPLTSMVVTKPDDTQNEAVDPELLPLPKPARHMPPMYSSVQSRQRFSFSMPQVPRGAFGPIDARSYGYQRQSSFDVHALPGLPNIRKNFQSRPINRPSPTTLRLGTTTVPRPIHTSTQQISTRPPTITTTPPIRTPSSDPKLIMSVPDSDLPLCLDLPLKTLQGTFQLIHNSDAGIKMNGQLRGGKFRKIGFIALNIKVKFTLDKIQVDEYQSSVVNQRRLSWDSMDLFNGSGCSLRVSSDSSAFINCANGFQSIISRRLLPNGSGYMLHVNIKEMGSSTANIEGLVGQFFHDSITVTKKRGNRARIRLATSRNSYRAHKRAFSTDGGGTCWYTRSFVFTNSVDWKKKNVMT